MSENACQPFKFLVQICIENDCRYFNTEKMTCDYTAIVKAERFERAKKENVKLGLMKAH